MVRAKFKAGHIVPRWIGAKANDRRCQHGIRFGCDISIEGGVIYAESDGPIMHLTAPLRRMKNGTEKVVTLTVSGIHIDRSRVGACGIGLSVTKQ